MQRTLCLESCKCDKDCMIDQNFKCCTCMKRLVDDFVIVRDGIVDTSGILNIFFL